MKMTINFPPEILRLILGNLNLQDRIRLRLVSRQWRAVIESLKVENLSIVDLKFNSRENWLSTELNGTGDDENLLYYQDSPLIPFSELFANLTWSLRILSLRERKTKLHSLLFDPRNPMFSRVKRLFVSLRAIDDFSFEEYINCQFEHLEEFSCYSLSFFSTTCLQLANLRVLSMQAIAVNEERGIVLDLPKLEQFTTFSPIQYFGFVHPQSLLHLIVWDDHKTILQFTNLQVLRCMRYENERAIFANLPQLKEMHYHSLEHIDQINLEAIYQTKQRLGRNELKMLVLGLDYPDYRRLNVKAKQIAGMVNEFIGENYAKLYSWNILSSVLNLHYNKLAASFDQRIPSDFKVKFQNLRALHVTSIESEVQLFFRFLANYPHLCRLQLHRAFDSLADYQTCYDLLPVYCRRLRQLDIRSELRVCVCPGICSCPGVWSGPGSSTFDPGFLLKFKYLQQLATDLNLAGTIALRMWQALKHLKRQHLVGKVEVRKIKDGLFSNYSIYFSDPNKKSVVVSFDKLVEFFVKYLGDCN